MVNFEIIPLLWTHTNIIVYYILAIRYAYIFIYVFTYFACFSVMAYESSVKFCLFTPMISYFFSKFSEMLNTENIHMHVCLSAYRYISANPFPVRILCYIQKLRFRKGFSVKSTKQPITTRVMKISSGDLWIIFSILSPILFNQFSFFVTLFSLTFHTCSYLTLQYTNSC